VRDKIAASKRKGLWVGGPVPLSYRCFDKKLEIMPEKAEAVRTIFRRYLELVIANPADARDRLKGAIVGGAAGHYAGHHGIIGAAVGCGIGRHEARKHDRERYRDERSREH
jgi:hypothetical protein